MYLASRFASLLVLAATRPSVRRPPRLRSGRGCFRQQFKPQRAGDGGCFDQPYCYAVAEPVRGAARATYHRVLVLLIAKVFVPDGARRNESVRTGIIELDEQARTGNAGDTPFKGDAYLIGKKMGEQSVEGLALGFHSAPFRG